MTEPILIQDADTGLWWRFAGPKAVLTATRLDDVLPVLREIEERVNAANLWAAGYIGYEAGPAFDPAIRAHPPGALPLLQFGLFEAPQLTRLPPAQDATRPRYRWAPSVAREQYDAAIARIRGLIAEGETYQVNYTLRLRAPMEEPPWNLFLRAVHANAPRHGAYLDCGRFVVCSASPELFFRLDGEELASRPMKGTGGRGLWLAQDEERERALAASPKDRAENVMIVDMARNDLGRVCTTGSVRVPELFTVERYPTVWQMTSTVTGRTTAPVTEILRALFPPASITGAPKARATRIIASLETAPRGVYTGCIGFIAPGRRARFNVAIRTACFDLQERMLEYGVGGGIVWDSTSEAEYDECVLKARIVTDAPPEFSLLETLLWEPEGDFFLLEGHLERLARSARYFGVPADLEAIRARLARLAAGFERGAQRVRLTVARDGTIDYSAEPLADPPAPVRLGMAAAPIARSNPFLYNKTTYRAMYDEARASRPGCDDVVLWNDRGEITETTIANLVVELDGERVTPPVECGLLPGVFRGWLLTNGLVRERRLSLDELRRASRIWVVNSVRKWREAVLAGSD
jgi:para-aminobenzoate synthetase/4-amino-4-deoxychorismate lyase